MFDFIERFKTWTDNLDIDFCRWRYPAMATSGVLVVLSWLAFFVIGPNYGTDFTGGTEIHLKFDEKIDVGDLRAGLRHLGLGDDSVVAVNGEDSGQFMVRISDPTFGMEGLEGDVRKALADLYGPNWVQAVQSSAEVSARFLVTHEAPYKEYVQVEKDLQKVFPGAHTVPGKDELQIAIEIPGLAERIKDRIATEMGAHTFEVLSTDSVGPKVGAELRRSGFVAMLATMGLILVYTAFRFDLEYAPGAVVALFHDISMTIGVFVVFQLSFDLQTIGALLTILGYSINDTIVIYDRIRENKDRYRRSDTTTLINKSVSETLARTIATNFTVFLAILTFLVWGGPVLRNFAIAMLCGQIFGTYSTVYIASPLIIIFEDLKPTLSKLIAFSDTGPGSDGAPGSDDDGGSGPGLTESEKRRRARADAEKREQLG
ncbi:MAG: protein translocase subunit SecF [Myxococcota bacterium]